MQINKLGSDSDALAPTIRRYSTKLAHPTYSIEPCGNPDCLFPEADGGYCPECGWTQFDPTCPHCKKANR